MDFFASVRPYLRELINELNGMVPYASVLAENNRGKSWRVSATGLKAGDEPMNTNCGFVVRLWKHGFVEYAFDMLPSCSAGEFARQILSAVRIPMTQDEIPEDTPENYDRVTDYGIDPETIGSKAILEKMSALREKAMQTDERILDCSASFGYQRIQKLFISPAKDISQQIIRTNAALFVQAARGEEIKESYRSFSMLGGAELLDRVEEKLPEITRTVIELLDSEPIEPGEYECVCKPDVTGMIVHEAFGHGVEMDMFVKKRAQAERFIGKYVASPLVTMRDGAASAREVATYWFDDEGTQAGDTLIIDKGILKQGICDAVSAGRLGYSPTGNGRRQNFSRKAYTRMTNTFFEGGKDSVEDMIASVKSGFLLEEAMSGMEDPKNWGIQCMVNIAREIKDGKLTGKVYSPIVLTGYVPDLLKSISMVSPLVELEGGGYCGKGYKEWVKVSAGGPYIKAKIRLG